MPHRDSDSDTASSSRRKRKKRTHARSGSSSSDNSSDRYRRKKKSGHSSHDKSRRRRSRSNSSSRYSSTKGSSSRRRRSGSRHRRSRSWSPGPRRRSRTPKHRSRRSRSSSSSRRRSWSGSDSPRRSRKASASISPKRVRRPGDPLPPKTGNETDQLKQKIQQVIKAAATASAELRERGLLPTGSSKEGAATESGTNTPPSVLEQLERARLIDDINAPSFSQQSFVSRREHGKKDTAASTSKVVDNHAAAIFGSFESLMAAAKEVVPLSNWREKPDLLIHPNLKEAPEVKLERWRKKLAAERRKRVNGTTAGGLVRGDL
ncbi:serine/arginine repetitive matrix protein 1-like [Dermacentor silvarum]|uniref:serine/arginine repetitive matrix protein 1-like n=1 Tax=Dermacentor silvarum TaxID=543639 RepID=UPI00189A48F7|nr:serine/arginine repetitive matrix protein 1-like [Dermacentor silvarum]